MNISVEELAVLALIIDKEEHPKERENGFTKLGWKGESREKLQLCINNHGKPTKLNNSLFIITTRTLYT
jgi:hypothetical protein